MAGPAAAQSTIGNTAPAAEPLASATAPSPAETALNGGTGAGTLEEDEGEGRLLATEAIAIARKDPKIADWLKRYKGVRGNATAPDQRDRWVIHFRAPGTAGEVAQAEVSDATGKVEEAWTGPQVAWRMARGTDGAFGRRINDPIIWLGLCAVFLLGLLDWRRPFSLRTLDLVALLSFSVSLAFFNEGLIFWSVPLSYPPMLYLLGRLVWLGFRGGRRPAYVGRLPIFLLAGAAVFLIGFRGGLNAYNSNVIDVGYAGTIGADRLIRGDIPYGNMPTNKGQPCGKKYADGSSMGYRQLGQGGRCETPNERGDTYGPVTYAAYVPAVAAVGWTGLWDDLPSAHVTSVVFDLLCALGLFVIGRRFGGWALGTALAFAWAAYPFTAYALASNSNDMIVAAFLIWAFAALTSPLARGGLLALAAWTKFAPLVLLPLWARYPRRPREAPQAWPYDEPDAPPPPRPSRAAQLRALVRELRETRGLGLYVLGVAAGTGLAGLLLVGGGGDALRTFWNSTFGWQLDRPSPFSLWDWGIYPGMPDLSIVQTALKALLLLGGIALLFVPRRLDAMRLAALSGALLIGFELVLTHWFYLYIPWFFPFVVLALCLPSREGSAA